MIGGLIRLSDQYTEITNKLKVVAGEQTNVNARFDRLVGSRTRRGPRSVPSRRSASGPR